MSNEVLKIFKNLNLKARRSVYLFGRKWDMFFFSSKAYLFGLDEREEPIFRDEVKFKGLPDDIKERFLNRDISFFVRWFINKEQIVY